MPQDTPLPADMDMVTISRQELEALQARLDAEKARADEAERAISHLQADILCLHQELGSVLQRERWVLLNRFRTCSAQARVWTHTA